MKAVIIENRYGYDEVQKVIGQHLMCLPGWSYEWINDPSIKTMNDYNHMLTSLSFWENQPEKVLIFQMDSGILREGIDEFMDWDYIGAPWKFQNHGGNGGLSLRSTKAMIDCINAHTYSPSKHGNEDIYFSNYVGRLAPREVCSKFSVETIFELGTFGYHAIESHHGPDEVKQIMNQYD